MHAVLNHSRVRRSSDGMIAAGALALAVLLISLTAAFAQTTRRADRQALSWLYHFPRPVAIAVASAAGLACLVMIGVAVNALAQRDRGHLVSGLTAAVGGGLVSLALIAGWSVAAAGARRSAINSGRPAALTVDAALIAAAVGSEALRRGRWRTWCRSLILLLLVASLAERSIRPVPLVLALAAAGLVGFGIRFVRGASVVRPGPDELRAWLAARGLPVSGLEPVGDPASEVLRGDLADGSRIELRLADRDGRLEGALRRAWSIFRLRPSTGGRSAFDSRSRLRELALVCCLAEKAGVCAPELLVLEAVRDRTLALVTRVPSGRPVGSPLAPEKAESLFSALRSLHRAGIVHRGLRAGHLVSDGESVGFASLELAAPAATSLARQLDLAQMLTTVAQASDPPTAVGAMRRGYGEIDEAAVASVLQPLALAPWGWSAMRSAGRCLTEVRKQLVEPGARVPAVRLERFRWKTVVSVVALMLAAYVIVGQLSSVNLVGALSRMSLWWFAVALAASAVTYVAAAASIEAFVPQRLSLLRTSLVQVAAGFVGVAMPSSVGYFALNARYLSRQRLDQASVAAAIALAQIANAATTIVVVISLALLTGSGLSPASILPGTDVLFGVAAAAAVLASLTALPQTRARLSRWVLPHVRQIIPRLAQAVAQPARLAASVAASIVLNAGYVVAFMSCLAAIGAHAALLPTAMVFLLGNFVGGAAPTPGGVGGVEAALAAGLATIGVPAREAIPAVVVFRFATFWLPIPVGWVSYVTLQRRGDL